MGCPLTALSYLMFLFFRHGATACQFSDARLQLSIRSIREALSRRGLQELRPGIPLPRVLVRAATHKFPKCACTMLSRRNSKRHQPPTLRAVSTARNALAHLPVVNPKARARGLVDTLAPCSPWCSKGTYTILSSIPGSQQLREGKMFLYGERYLEPDGLHKALFQLVQKIRCGTIRLDVPGIMKPSKCNEQ